MSVLRGSKAVRLLVQIGDMSILKVRKDDTLLGENRDMYTPLAVKIITISTEKWTWLY